MRVADEDVEEPARLCAGAGVEGEDPDAVDDGGDEPAGDGEFLGGGCGGGVEVCVDADGGEGGGDGEEGGEEGGVGAEGGGVGEGGGELEEDEELDEDGEPEGADGVVGDWRRMSDL